MRFGYLFFCVNLLARGFPQILALVLASLGLLSFQHELLSLWSLANMMASPLSLGLVTACLLGNCDHRHPHEAILIGFVLVFFMGLLSLWLLALGVNANYSDALSFCGFISACLFLRAYFSFRGNRSIVLALSLYPIALYSFGLVFFVVDPMLSTLGKSGLLVLTTASGAAFLKMHPTAFSFAALRFWLRRLLPNMWQAAAIFVSNLTIYLLISETKVQDPFTHPRAIALSIGLALLFIPNSLSVILVPRIRKGGKVDIFRRIFVICFLLCTSLAVTIWEFGPMLGGRQSYLVQGGEFFIASFVVWCQIAFFVTYLTSQSRFGSILVINSILLSVFFLASRAWPAEVSFFLAAEVSFCCGFVFFSRERLDGRM